MNKEKSKDAAIRGRCEVCAEVHEAHAGHEHEVDEVDDCTTDLLCAHEFLCRMHCSCVACLTGRARTIALACLDDCMTAGSLAELVGGADASIVHSHCFGAPYTSVLVRGATIPSLDGVFDGDPCGNNDLVLFIGDQHEAVAGVRERVTRSQWTEAAFATCAGNGRTVWTLATVKKIEDDSEGIDDPG